MSRLNDLIRQTKSLDAGLGEALEREAKALSGRRAFGLNFERHRPEAVDLPKRPIRRGDKVRILPPRGSISPGDQRLWKVSHTESGSASRWAHLVRASGEGDEAVKVSVNDLIVVAEFQDVIYPGLISTGSVRKNDEKPCHTVINGENYHALKALTYTHKGKIDAIYIDPPYNSGAKDWKYNNDYVDAEDLYRHSKWLAFMERRLAIAKELLNPDNSVLIVTIDEREYLRLGLLLEQVFPDARITMVTSSISAGGVSRTGTFGRSAEYLYFVQFGGSRPTPLPLEGEWNAVNTKNKEGIYWSRLLRAGTNALRTDRPNQFYPVYLRLTDDGPVFHSVGAVMTDGEPNDNQTPEGCVAVWPIRRDNSHGRWQTSPDGLRDLIEAGCARLGKWNGEKTTIYYLKRGERAKVDNGIYEVIGRSADGSVLTGESGYTTTFIPTDVWRLTSHDAGNSGSRLIEKLLPGRKFPFPKSLYAVEDALRFFIKNKPNAIVLDFFAGSGTTAHAVMRLNRQYGGDRQCISVTNNEVSADEQRRLSKADTSRSSPYDVGLRPGDPEWEAFGICDYITKPRIAAAITGNTPQGAPIKGDYRFTDEFPMNEGFDENAEFFTLTYETPISVGHNKAFQRIAALLWLRAGARGPRLETVPEKGWAMASTYGVLFDLDKTAAFCKEVEAAPAAKFAYIVTNDERRFQAIARRLPNSVEPVRLYESYLSNFRFANGE